MKFMKFAFWADPLCLEVEPYRKLPWGFRIVRLNPFRHRFLVAVFPLNIILRFFWKIHIWTFFVKWTKSEEKLYSLKKEK